MSIGDDIAALTDELRSLSGLALRVECNKIRRALDSLNPPKPTEPREPYLEPMTYVEAAEYGQQLMGFGRYADITRDEVPHDYLGWLVEEKKTEWRQLVRYLKARKDGDEDSIV